jgi:hypothetical protein
MVRRALSSCAPNNIEYSESLLVRMCIYFYAQRDYEQPRTREKKGERSGHLGYSAQVATNLSKERDACMRLDNGYNDRVG